MDNDKNEDEFYILLGQNIANKRKECGYTQKQLAEKINTSQGVFANFEIGKRRISVKKLFEISKVLNILISDLFPYQDNKNDLSNIINSLNALPEEEQATIIKSVKLMIDAAKRKTD